MRNPGEKYNDISYARYCELVRSQKGEVGERVPSARYLNLEHRPDRAAFEAAKHLLQWHGDEGRVEVAMNTPSGPVPPVIAKAAEVLGRQDPHTIQSAAIGYTATGALVASVQNRPFTN